MGDFVLEHMSKNTQIETLARVIALVFAEGDTEKAEEIITWASGCPCEQGEKKPKDGTTSFIRRYLTPYAPYDKEKIERFIRRFIVNKQGKIDISRVRKTIENMPYQDFLNTIYWRGVSLFIKRRDGWKCTECGSSDKVEVHHKTYNNHGDETNNLNNLTTLCEKCHKEAHSRMRMPQ